ncbi:HAD-IA family hydrolase [Candidatus Saccharibacteria bacterium]|nr:HAD-IA family hydrolase [Candidatus Saccharibacteria bacterium]
MGVNKLIKAVIFDCFGVLVGSSYEPFKQKYLSHDQTLIDRFNEVDHLSSEGKITNFEAYKEFAKLANLPLQEATVLLDDNPKNNELFEFIKNNLVGKYKIGYLSNSASNYLAELFTEDDVALFDDIILSYKFGMAKPAPEIYKLSAEHLGVQPSECVFIDDQQKYLLGAEKTGMKTILYKNYAEFKSELKEVLND